MALDLTPLLEEEGQSNAGDETVSFRYITAEFTPDDNCLIVAVVSLIRQSVSELINSTTTSVEGGGLDWERGVSVDDSNTSDGYCGCLEIWTAPVTTGALMDLTVATTGTSEGNRRAQLNLAFLSDYDTADPTGATATATDLGDGAFSMDLGASPAAESIVIAARQHFGWITTADPATGWTELYDTTSGDQYNTQSQYRGGSTSVAVAWDDVNVANEYNGFNLAVALEIKAAAGGGVGAASQDATPAQVATGALALAATAAQDTTPSQTVTGAVVLTGTASLDATPGQTAAGALALTGSAAQDVTPSQTAAGVGVAGNFGVAAQDTTPSQVATGALALAAAASQDATPAQTAAGVLAIAAIAAQDATPSQTATGVEVVEEVPAEPRRRKGGGGSARHVVVRHREDDDDKETVKKPEPKSPAKRKFTAVPWPEKIPVVKFKPGKKTSAAPTSNIGAKLKSVLGPKTSLLSRRQIRDARDLRAIGRLIERGLL